MNSFDNAETYAAGKVGRQNNARWHALHCQ